jgi:hypothetical protein
MAKLKISLWNVGRQSDCVSVMGISSGAVVRVLCMIFVVNPATSNIRAVPKSLSCAMPSSDTLTLSYRGTEGSCHTDEFQHTTLISPCTMSLPCKYCKPLAISMACSTKDGRIIMKAKVWRHSSHLVTFQVNMSTNICQEVVTQHERGHQTWWMSRLQISDAQKLRNIWML